MFGFHLASVDLRQSSDQHVKVIAELLKLEVTLLQPTKSASQNFLETAAQLSQASVNAYRRLAYETPGLNNFFSAISIREIAELNIRSWPTSRKVNKAPVALFQKMVKQWFFFKTLLFNIDMVLAKSDLALASR